MAFTFSFMYVIPVCCSVLAYYYSSDFIPDLLNTRYKVKIQSETIFHSKMCVSTRNM